MSTIKVTVTQEDIDNGVQREGSCCAIAKALERLGYKEPMVEVPTVYIGNDGYRLPKVADDWACQFDEDKSKVAPFSFELEELHADYYA